MSFLNRLMFLSRFPANLATAFVAGGVSALAMAPLNLWPILILGLGVLYLLLVHAPSKKSAFFIGWLFGFSYFFFGLTWVGNALLVEGNPYLWALPLAVTGLPALLAFFPAFGCLIAKWAADLRTLWGYAAFTAAYAFAEWARGHFFTGFPWNLFGYTWADIPEIVQVVSFSNTYFLTWFTIIWLSVAGFLFVWNTSNRNKIVLCVVLLADFGAYFAFGAWRLHAYEPSYHENYRVRIVQPNIMQDQKWDRTKMGENFFKHVRLSYPQDEDTRTIYIIWPETALTFWFTQDPSSMYVLKQALQSYRGKAYLITGLLNHNPETGDYSNSMVMIDQQGVISNLYDKHHLVPFGEYIPFQRWVPIKAVTEFSGFKMGKGPALFETPEGMRYSPLICYEAIFPGAVAGPEGKTPRADVMINVTNDAWYGISAGPHQHLTNVRFRAVEEGIPLVRSANTGVSALVDPLGRIIYETDLFTDNAHNVELPKRIEIPVTSGFFKNAIFLLLTMLVILVPRAKKILQAK